MRQTMPVGPRPRRMALLLALLFGCAHQTGERATAGIVTELESEESGETRGAEVSEEIGRGLARGILDELNRPEQREQLGAAAALIARRALEGATGRRPGREASPGGRGGTGGSGAAPQSSCGAGARPSEESPAAVLADQLATAFAAGVSEELVRQLDDGQGPLAQGLAAATESIVAAATGSPECVGPGREQCIERRIAELSGAATAGALRSSLPLLAAVFLAGALAAVSLGALVLATAHLKSRK